MQLLRQALAVARMEAAALRGAPSLRLSLLAICLIPALYAFIYLESVWDPASRTSELPALVVNLDRGTDINGQHLDLGAELAATLQQKRTFGFRPVADPQAAREAVRRGDAFFALIIPPDFSANAMSAQSAGAGKLVVFASEGNNYAGAGFAKRFAFELGHQVNETLSEKRWAAVLGAAAASSDNLHRLRDGVAALREGAIALDAGIEKARSGSGQLAEGAGRLSTGVAGLTDGMKQLGGGVRTLDARRPQPADLQAARDGAARLAAGHQQMQPALASLEDGARRLREGATALAAGAEEIPFGGSQVAAGAGQLADGAGQLHSGLRAFGDSHARLATGSQSLSSGVERLADGFAAYSAGVSTLANRLPPDARLDELARGGQQLAQSSTQLHEGMGRLRGGGAQLAAGLDTVARSLPDGVAQMSGTPRGLAMPVEPQLEIDAPVGSNGMGFAPNFIPVALWMGATMVAFVFHLRLLPQQAQGLAPAALLLGKMCGLGCVNLAQALCVLLMAWLLLGLHPVHAAGLALTMVASALTFMAVVLLLVRTWGDAGKALALMLLILQLSSAGGVMPIELTNDFFRAISPWLPFTWSVKAVRASAFGAFGGEWVSANAMLLLFAAGAFGLSLVVGRWKFVPDSELRPAVDL